jgi:DNA-binding protein H-NS
MATAKHLELIAQAQKLLDQAEALRKEEMASVIVEVVETLNSYQIKLADLKAAGYAYGDPVDGPSFGKRAPSSTPAPSTSVAKKYRDPKDASNEWSGRGRTPKWMQAYLEAGKSKEEFLIR